MRCQCLSSNLLRRSVGKYGEYVVVKVRCSPAACGLFALSVRDFNPCIAFVYGLLSVSTYFPHVSLRAFGM